MGNPDWKNESGDHFQQHAKNNLLEIYPWLLQDCLDLFGDLTEKEILEIGGGPGYMASHFLKNGVKKLIEADLSNGMLSKSKILNHDPRIHFLQANACYLPLKEKTFDLVFSRGSIFFWEDLHRAFVEIRRLLKPRGMAILGGGFGLNTPDEILDRIKSAKSGSKPKLDLDKLLKLANSLGGKAQILNKKGKGFWLVWQPNLLENLNE